MTMSEEEKVKFTEQRRDTSVPAAVGEQAGPQASTSNDRSVPRVDLLAPGASNAPREEKRQFLRPPMLLVENRPPSRSPSLTSLVSVTSEKSVFSNATAKDLESCNEDRERSKALRTEEARCLEEIAEQVSGMLKACLKQPNVAMTIKDGLKKCKELVDAACSKHKEADLTDQSFDRGLVYTEEARQLRQKWRDGIQARQIRKVVLECNKRKKEESPPAKQQAKKVRTEATFADKAKVAKKKQTLTAEPKAPDPTKGKRALVERPRQKKKTMLIKVAEGQTYASVLGKLRKEVKPEQCESEVVGVRPTQKGDLLLTLGEGSKVETFAAKVAETVGDMATVQSRDDQRVTLEIRDLDSLTEEGEVVEALERVLLTPRTNRTVRLLAANKRGQKLAVVTVTRREAAILERLGHVKVGFLSCCVRKRVAVIRCHQCLGFGHKAVDCSGVDRSTACFKCGEIGHTVASCKGPPRCFLCSDTQGAACDHVSGSGQCAAFRKALEAARHQEALKRR